MRSFARAGLVPVFLALVFLALPGVAGAAPVVTEADVLSMLDDGFPAVVERSRSLPLARAEVLAARAFDNPVLEVVREDPGGSVVQTEWLVSWQLPRWRRRLEVAAAEKSVDAAAARVDYELSSLRSVLRRDFASWVIASARRQVLEGEAARLAALVSRERARAEKGESSGLEVHRIGLAETALRTRLVLTAAAEQQTRAEVARWLPSLAPDAWPALPALPAARPYEPLLAGEHPLVTATRAELEAVELEKLASKRYFSSPVLTVGWQRQEAFSVAQSGPVLGVSWALPLFDRKQASRGAARARLEAVRARATTTVREIAARRVTVGSRYADLVRAVVESNAARETHAELLVGAETSFRYGELTLTDLLDVQRAVTDARLARLDLYAAALAAHRELEALARPSSHATYTKDTEP